MVNIIEEEGKLFLKQELSIEQIEDLIKEEESLIADSHGRIEHYKQFLPVEKGETELEEVTEGSEEQVQEQVNF